MEVLYVTFNSDPALHNDSTLGAYSVDSSGSLTDLTSGTPYATATDPISVLAVNTYPAGENTGGVFVYVGSQANQSGALSVFQVCPAENAGCQANLSWFRWARQLRWGRTRWPWWWIRRIIFSTLCATPRIRFMGIESTRRRAR